MGQPKAMRAWFYPGDNFGQEFRYPKHLRQIEVASLRTVETVTPPPPVPEPEATIAQAEPAPAPQVQEPAPAPEAAPEAKVEEQVTIAQNTPPPPPAEAAPAPAAEETKTPEELPKTATPYPLIGLGGLFALSLYGLVRLKRTA